MATFLNGHPGVRHALVEVRGYQCPRCDDGPNWIKFGISRAVPLADGVTLVCWWHATPEERRNRWCSTCATVKDESEFDRIDGGRRYRLSCRACLSTAPVIEPVCACARCGATFIPSRSDARYCSGRCRVAAHRARRGSGSSDSN